MSIIFALVIFIVSLTPVTSLAELGQYAYYGYVPVGTDAGDPNEFDGYPLRRNIDELINGKIYNYTAPEGTALLDIIGVHENTHVEIWDIMGKERLDSKTVNKLEKWTYFIKLGTFFKVVADKRVSVYQNGGHWFIYNGDMTFYPSDDEGFVGKKFTFVAPKFPDAYITYRYGSNFLCTALEDAHVTVYDSTEGEVMSFDLKQGESLPYNRGRLASRVSRAEPTSGGGNSVIFHAESTGLVTVRTVNQGSFLAVPAITGGFVGKIFVTPSILAVDDPGAEEVIVVIPIEPGKVTIYDSKLSLISEKSFSQSDIDDKVYWFYSLGKSSRTIIVMSTCSITLLEGCTWIPPEMGKTTIGIEDLGSNIAYMGARANEETRFYVPTTATIFAPEDLTVTVDGERKELKQDGFILLDRGVHSVIPDHDVVIQIDSAGNIGRVEIWDIEAWARGSERLLEVRQTYWGEWGSYLIAVEDVRKTFEVPNGFAETPGRGIDYTMIIAGAVAVAAVAGGIFMLRKRKTSGKRSKS